MRVLHVAGAIDREIGGSAFAAIHTAGYLRTQGVDAVLAASVAEEGRADYIADDWPSLPVHSSPRRAPRHYWNAPGLRRWLHREVPRSDLVVVHGLFKIPFVDAARVARRHSVPYLVHPHGSLDPYDLRKHRQLKVLYGPLVVRRMLDVCAGVVVTTQREADRLVTYGATPDVHVLPLAVPGPPGTPSGERFRQRFGIAPGTAVVLFFSRFDRKKGIERLLSAVAELRSSRTDFVLVMAGRADDPAYEQEVRRAVSRLDLDDLVVWTGFLLGDDKWDALAGADVLVLPSDNENFGIVVVEALLAGTPVLISDEVYLADDLRDIGGATICGRDVESVRAELASVLDRAEDARASAAAGAAMVRDAFSPASVTRRTVELYEAVTRAPLATPD